MAGASEEGGKARGGTSDAAVRSKTGKSWQEWFTILDQAGAMEMDHKGIVGYLKENHSISPWWQQHVTVAYEQERGLRQVHEMPEGYQISRSKTINASLSSLYAAWLRRSFVINGLGMWLSIFALPVRRNPCASLGTNNLEV